MINSSPVPPHELQVQFLTGEITTSSLRVLATATTYNSNESRSIGYLYGEYGVMADLDDHFVTIRLLRPVGRFRSGHLRCPPFAGSAPEWPITGDRALSVIHRSHAG